MAYEEKFMKLAMNLSKKARDLDEVPVGAVIIKDGVVIGIGACIIGKVIVGENSEIGACAVVVKDVPENAVVVGNPARVLRIKES